MLGQLKTGEKGRIKSISGVDRFVSRRLLDFGISEGAEICVKSFMPFGGPIMVEAYGQCIAIRRREAFQIEVERV